LHRQVAPWAPFVRGWKWSNWCGRPGRFVFVARAVGMRESVRVPAARCRTRRRGTSLVRTRVPRTDGIPAAFIGADDPVPLSPSRIRVVNGWLVSNGRTLVAVYAGEAGDDPTVGSIVIVRQNLLFGIQTCDHVDLVGTKALRLTAAPLGSSVETSAQHADLGFSTGSGARGVLHLATDKAELDGLAAQQAPEPPAC
jgi:hypothetical protein